MTDTFSVDRRRLLQGVTGSSLLSIGSGHAAPTSATLQPLLDERLRAEGVALVAARIDGEQADVATASRGAGAGPSPDALFEIGSISKTFTALLLAEQVVRGETRLDDAVEAVLPRSLKLRDVKGAPLRWLDLATHRSGLPRLPSNLKPAQAADPYADYGELSLWDFVEQWQPKRERGEAYEYSNLSYGLLGHALGLRAGLPFAALLRQRVLQPLGLDGMLLSEAGTASVPGLLQGHDVERRPVPRWRFEVLAGAGALLGSVRHLARYAQAALGVLPTPLAQAFALALKPHADGPSPDTAVGLAWQFGKLRGRSVANHDGGTFGFSSSMFLDPERRRATVVLANAFVPVTDLALHLLEPTWPLRDPAAEARARQAEAVALSQAQLAPLAGVYALNPNFKLTLRAQGSQLFAQATGQGEFELFARSERLFFARVTPLEFEFEGHPVASLVLRQAGQVLRFVRE